EVPTPRPSGHAGARARGVGARSPAWGLHLVAVLAVLAGEAGAQDARGRDGAVATAAPRTGGQPLGIMARNTPTGVEVVSVTPGSAAQSAGIETGDSIVAVSGFQVGVVGDRVYDVGDEVARRVNTAGQVPLLVLSRRRGGLAVVPVQFATASRAISGVLTTSAGAQVPPTAVITVRLLDVTEPQWRDVALTQGQLPASRGFPVSYRIDPPTATAQHRYAVEARVEDGGRLLLQTAAPVALVSLDHEQRVDLPLVPVAAPTVVATAAPASQIQQWIQAYLGRPPRPYETEVWLADLQQGKSLADVQAGILSSSEFYERCRSTRDTYVTEVFRQLFGMPPSAAQLADLQARYDRAQGVRLPVVQQLLASAR
ncbi:MAG: YbaY family lipoprotein, partial [Planctomycetia bacterium]